MLSNGLQMHSRTNALPVSNTCKNDLVYINSGMFDLSKDVYDLRNVWNSCQESISAKLGRSNPNSEVSKVCKSASYNLQMLCNLTISDEQILNAKEIWQQDQSGPNICQGIL